MKSLDARFIECKGVGPGFDHLRIGLSLAILFWHSFGVAHGLAWTQSLPIWPIWPFRPFLAALLPMFFGLSGVLVIGSAIRLSSLRIFITFRVLRILPALFTEVSLSALVFGPLLTVVPLRTYFSSREFVEYFGSFIGRVRFVLPGLFLANPIPEIVNAALWTVGPEIFCYVILSLLILTRAYRQRRTMLAVTISFVLLSIAFDAVKTQPITELLPTRSLIAAFLAGNLIYLYCEKLPFSAVVATPVFLASVIAISAAQYSIAMHILVYPAVFGLAYVTSIIGFSRLPTLPFFHRGDYSYGIYIYGFPIQQAIEYFMPQLHSGFFMFAIALPLTLLCAVGSWHGIEKPFLSLRSRLLPAQKPDGDRHADRMTWTTKNLGTALALSAYAVFVARSSAVFSLHDAAHLFGQHSPADTEVRPQF